MSEWPLSILCTVRDQMAEVSEEAMAIVGKCKVSEVEGIAGRRSSGQRATATSSRLIKAPHYNEEQ